MSGWIAIDRGIFDHEFFAKEAMSEREAFIWMVAKAAWKDTEHRIGSTMNFVPRGSFYCTLRELQKAWGWASDKRVRGFLKRTQERTQAGRMIETKTDAGKTLITICNYDTYQSVTNETDAERTQARSQDGRSEDALKEQVNNKQDKKSKPKKEPAGSSLVSEPDQSSQAISIFNQIAEKVSWSQVQKLSPARKKALDARMKDVGGLQNWQAAIERAARSSFLSGKATGWAANFDWLCKAANFTKLMEGNYDDRANAGSTSSGSGIVGAAIRSQAEHSNGIPIHGQWPEEDDHGMLALGDGRF